MSKIIKPTEEYLAKCRESFEKSMNEQIEKMKDTKCPDGKVNFSAVFEEINQKAVLKFTTIAWIKMNSLIDFFDKEVAWHGLAKRGEQDNEYIIYDIIVYPQEVTGASVDTDQEQYQTWLMEFDDDVFFNIRMQGHSHVNMGVSPSGTDLTHQEKILQQLNDNMFYIFLIWNKKGSHHIKIYDMEKNIYFEPSDITVEVIPDETGLLNFINDAKEKIKEKTFKSSYVSNKSNEKEDSAYRPTYSNNKDDEIAFYDDYTNSRYKKSRR